MCGYTDRSELVSPEKNTELASDYWYRQYHNAQDDATRDYIEPRELKQFVFCCRCWFNPLESTRPRDFPVRHRPGVMRSGLIYSDSDIIRCTQQEISFKGKVSFPCGRMTGHPGGDVDWFLQNEGRIINIELPRDFTDMIGTLQVRRLPNGGWELASDYLVLRAIDPSSLENATASNEAIDNLWFDYTSEMHDQEIPQNIKQQAGDGYPCNFREVPKIDRLMNTLSWRTGVYSSEYLPHHWIAGCRPHIMRFVYSSSKEIIVVVDEQYSFFYVVYVYSFNVSHLFTSLILSHIIHHLFTPRTS